MIYLGVDGCAGGWLAAEVDGRDVRWRFFPGFADIVDAYPSATIGVDMPIGLVDSGQRSCDLAARAFLQRAAASIFLAPTADHLARWRQNPRHETGLHVSVQAWNLLPKIAEVAPFVTKKTRKRIVEVHPECSFRAMGPRVAFAGKTTADGAAQRITALRKHFDVPDFAAPGKGVAIDALDALAAAWSAKRHAKGKADYLGEDVFPRITV